MTTENNKLYLHATKTILEWWRKHTRINKLKVVASKLTTIDQAILQELVNRTFAIQSACEGNGAGLTAGSLVDMLVTKTLEGCLDDCQINHHGQNDLKINDTQLSLKKIKGKSIIALNWSKNPSNTRERWTSDTLILNLQAGCWWKKGFMSQNVKIGFYLVDKNFCNHVIRLTTNNKSNSVISSKFLYKMLNRAHKLGTFVELPNPSKNLIFDITKAFK